MSKRKRPKKRAVPASTNGHGDYIIDIAGDLQAARERYSDLKAQLRNEERNIGRLLGHLRKLSLPRTRKRASSFRIKSASQPEEQP